MKKITLILTILLAAGLIGSKYVSAQNVTIPITAVSFPRDVIDRDGGTIDFYGKLSGFSGSIPSGGCTPYFFEERGTDYYWHLGFNSNDGLGGGGLTGDGSLGGYYNASTGGYGSWNYEQALGAGQVDLWHHYKFVWDKDGLFGNPQRRMDIYVDDVINSHYWLDYYNQELVDITEGTLNLISTGNPGCGTLSGMIAIDEFKVYDRNGNLVLYNSLGSATEVTNSITGPDGSYNGGGNAHFITGVVGNAVEANPVSGFGIEGQTDLWTQKADFGGTARNGAIAFSIGDKGYMGTGGDNLGVTRDFWEYNPVTDVWTQKADYGGGPVGYGEGFSIGTKGYVGLGWDGSVLRKDFWEFDPVANTWTQKADFGGTARHVAASFSIGSKGYIGTGGGGVSGPFEKDFWEYNPATDTWTKKANFSGTGRCYSTGFSIGNKGYIGTGYTNGGYVNDFWEYDPATNTWIQKANYPGAGLSEDASFSIGSKGYMGIGYTYGNTRDFWEYDPVTNVWTRKADFGGSAMHWAAYFSMGGKGYIGTGYTGGSSLFNYFWEYDPGTTTACTAPTGETTANITATTAKLKWDAVDGAAGYVVRYNVVGSEDVTMKSTLGNARKIIDLTPATDYMWQVRTFCSSDPPYVTSKWSAQQFFTTGTLKLADEQPTTLNVYPNPTDGQFKIAITLGDEETSPAIIQVLNSLGQIMYNEKTSIANGMLLQEINLKDLPAGMYLVKVIVNDQVYSAPINFQK